jgi:hypothetical protein
MSGVHIFACVVLIAIAMGCSASQAGSGPRHEGPAPFRSPRPSQSVDGCAASRFGRVAVIGVRRRAVASKDKAIAQAALTKRPPVETEGLPIAKGTSASAVSVGR